MAAKRTVPASVRVIDARGWLTEAEWAAREHKADPKTWQVVYASDQTVRVRAVCVCGDSGCAWVGGVSRTGTHGSGVATGTWYKQPPGWRWRAKLEKDRGVKLIRD